VPCHLPVGTSISYVILSYRGTNRRLEFEDPYILNLYMYKRIIIISLYSQIWTVKALKTIMGRALDYWRNME